MFAACFVGCVFALVVCALAAWQFGGWFLHRKFSRAAPMIVAAIASHPGGPELLRHAGIALASPKGPVVIGPRFVRLVVTCDACQAPVDFDPVAARAVREVGGQVRCDRCGPPREAVS